MNEYSLRINGRIVARNLAWAEANKRFERLAKAPGDAILNDDKPCRWIERISRTPHPYERATKKSFPQLRHR
jgi:hypothetical protein